MNNNNKEKQQQLSQSAHLYKAKYSQRFGVFWSSLFSQLV